MNNLFILLILLFFGLNLWSQEKDSTYEVHIPTSYGDFTMRSIYSKDQHSESRMTLGHFSFKKIDDSIVDEAEKANVTNDKVTVKVEINPKGELVGFVIAIPGKLATLNVFVQKAFDELLINSKGKMIFSPNSTGENTIMNFPLRFNLQ